MVDIHYTIEFVSLPSQVTGNALILETCYNQEFNANGLGDGISGIFVGGYTGSNTILIISLLHQMELTQ